MSASVRLTVTSVFVVMFVPLMVFGAALLIALAARPSARGAYFLVVSDLHLDLHYSAAANISTMCRPMSAWARPLRSGGGGSGGGGSGALDVTPLYPMRFGRVGCDAPYDLVRASLLAMRQEFPEPQFVLMLGDFSAHYTLTADETMANVRNATLTIQEIFPGTIVYPVLGNDDGFPDYGIAYGPNGWLDTLATLFTPWLSSSALATFRRGGYYSAMLSSLPTGTKMIALNTVYLAPRWTNGTNVNEDVPSADPAGQFAWLRSELAAAQAANQRVLIVGHIAPTQNSYDNEPVWQDWFVSEFNGIVQQYASTVAMQLYGHFHRDTIRVFFDGQSTDGTAFSAALLAGSISPIFANNPSYKVTYWDPSSATLFNQVTYYSDLALANRNGAVAFVPEYDYSSAYDMQQLSLRTLRQLFLTLRSSFETFAVFEARLTSLYWPNELAEICSLGHQTNLTYQACAQSGGFHYPNWRSLLHRPDAPEQQQQQQVADDEKHDPEQL